MLAKIKRALALMCVIFTVIISLMYVLGLLMSDSAVLLVPTPGKALFILLFSSIIGFASLLLSKDGTSPGRLIFHVILCLAAFVLCFIVGGNFAVTGSTGIIASVLYLIVYGIVMAVRAVICRRYKKAAIESEEYTSVF